MSLISSDREVVVDDINEICIRAADHYEKFEELLEDRDMTRELAGLAARRRRFARDLEEQIRKMGHLPSAPDPDREGVERLIARFRAAVSREGTAVLVSKCREIEEEIVASIDASDQYRLSEELRRLIEEIRKDALSARRWLEEELQRIHQD